MHITSRFFLGAASIALAVPSAAWGGEVVGLVTDENDTVALRAAEVRIVELGRAAATERDGSFTFADVPAGSYTLEAR